jgi:hypothetical protein
MPTMTVDQAKKLIHAFQKNTALHVDLLDQYIRSKNPSSSLKFKITYLDNWFAQNAPRKKIATWIVLEDYFEKAKALGLKKSFESYFSSRELSVCFIKNQGISDGVALQIQEELEEDVKQVFLQKAKQALVSKINALEFIPKERVLSYFREMLNHPYAKYFADKFELWDALFLSVSKRKDLDDDLRRQQLECSLALSAHFFLSAQGYCYWRPLQIRFALELIRNAYVDGLSCLEEKSESKQEKLARLDDLISTARATVENRYSLFGDVKKLASELHDGRIKKSLSELVRQIREKRGKLDAVLAPVMSK